MSADQATAARRRHGRATGRRRRGPVALPFAAGAAAVLAAVPVAPVAIAPATAIGPATAIAPATAVGSPPRVTVRQVDALLGTDAVEGVATVPGASAPAAPSRPPSPAVPGDLPASSTSRDLGLPVVLAVLLVLGWASLVVRLLLAEAGLSHASGRLRADGGRAARW